MIKIIWSGESFMISGKSRKLSNRVIKSRFYEIVLYCMDKIYGHFESGIPTYIINLEKRKDRRFYIEQEFLDRTEFNPTIVKAVEDKIPAVGLYKTVKQILQRAKNDSLSYVLICEDDHQFTSSYNKDSFTQAINDLNKEGIDVYLGGVSWFDYAITKKGKFYWVNSFTGTQFMVIYSRIYDTLLKADFHVHTTIDRWIAQLSDKVYVSVPMLSIQKDFGYSDVTEKNNVLGNVEQLFTNTINRWQSLNQIYDHIHRTKLVEILGENDCKDVQLPTYIINLKSRRDRLDHIINQFKDRNEFETNRVEACYAKNGAVGLWESIVKVVRLAKEREDEVILICEDDHMFCENYDKRILFSSIYQGAYLGADILLGGISNTRQAIPVNNYLCWIETFQCTQFTIVYNRFFDTILDTEFMESDAADLKLSSMTMNKYVIHPFISVQQDFGYSDIPVVGLDTDQYMNLFKRCHTKLDNLRRRISL